MSIKKWIVPLLLLMPCAQASNPAGIYSSLYFNEEGGDLLGLEVLLVPSSSGASLKYVAVVQHAEGGFPEVYVIPVIGELDGFRLELPINVVLEGKLVEDRLIIKWPQGDTDTLIKGKSYWQTER